MESQEHVSLHGFCRDNNLPKSTVYERCKMMGIITSDGLSADDCDRLLKEFNVKPKFEGGVHGTVSVTRPHVEVGNHQIVLSAPVLPSTLTIESLRSGSAMSFADPLLVASSVIENVDAVIFALDNDLQARKKMLQETVAAKEAAEQKAVELRLKSRMYQSATGSIAQAQTEATTGLSIASEALSPFIKKPDGESEPSS